MSEIPPKVILATDTPAKPSDHVHSSSGSGSLAKTQGQHRAASSNTPCLAQRVDAILFCLMKPGSSRLHLLCLSCVSAQCNIPDIKKWTVESLCQALSNAEVSFTRRMSKAELYGLLTSQIPLPGHLPAKDSSRKESSQLSSHPS